MSLVCYESRETSNIRSIRSPPPFCYSCILYSHLLCHIQSFTTVIPFFILFSYSSTLVPLPDDKTYVTNSSTVPFVLNSLFTCLHSFNRYFYRPFLVRLVSFVNHLRVKQRPCSLSDLTGRTINKITNSITLPQNHEIVLSLTKNECISGHPLLRH